MSAIAVVLAILLLFAITWQPKIDWDDYPDNDDDYDDAM